jgi:hypothetical protein
MTPLKTFLPPWKENVAIGTRKKITWLPILGSWGIIFPRAAGGGAAHSLALASLGIPEEGFF